MNFSKALVVHATSELREPVINSSENPKANCIENNVSIEYSTMYLSGTEPPLNIIFYDAIKIDRKWNYIPKKGENMENVCKKANIIHFKGSLKPWIDNGNINFLKYGKIWASYLN